MAKIATREAYGKALAELIKENEQVVVVDADLTKSTKTVEAKKVCPERHLNMGIAEGNMMSVAAGLAASGQIVYASSFAMFAAGRAFEQIRNSICYPKLNVKICATHAGLSVGEDGATHQSVEDLSIMRSIPNMMVFQPCDAVETYAMVKGLAHVDGPCYVRLGRCAVDDVYLPEKYEFHLGKGSILCQGKHIAILATGAMVQEALKASNELKRIGINPTIVNIHTIKPIDKDLIVTLSNSHDIIMTCEEHSIIGGLGSAVAEVTAKYAPKRVEMIGIEDTFGESGTKNTLFEKYGIDANAIVERVKTVIKGL